MASRKEEKERRRQERLAQERAATEAAQRRRTYGIFAGGVLVVATAVVVVILVAVGGGSDGGDGGSNGLGSEEGLPEAVDPPPQKIRDLTEAAKAANCKLSNPSIEGSTHVQGGVKVKYKTNPPASGNHDPTPANDGAYGKAPGIKHLVHSLEHGRIEYQFNPSIPKRRIAQLRGLFDQDPYHVILTPNPTKMPYRVVATAWGHIAGCKRITDESFDVLRTFKERYRDKGPEFVP
jgi:hypothetical protein